MKLYNTLTRQKEDFTPIKTGHINMFVCGPTVYDYAQLGNGKTFVQMDIIARSLQFLGYEVTYLQNITDIDDKIIARAQEKGMAWQDLTTKFTHAFLEDMKLLNVTSVTQYAAATDYIDDIIAQVQQLIDKDFAYQIDDGIYFEVAKFEGYGKLSGRQDVQEDDAQSRIDENEAKRGWNDFCLWKFSKPSEPIWKAPFGDGRPGWHIEDTAVTEHFFGPQYDIHGGAVDLIFPHHEAEITQMEAASGKEPLVRTWLHAGFLNVTGSRMGKSKGNFVTIRDVFEKGYDANTIRMLFAQGHYRSPLDFSWENLDGAGNRVKHWQQIVPLMWQLELANGTDIELSKFENDVSAALTNDIDMPKVVSLIDEVIAKLKAMEFSKSSLQRVIEIIDDLLGINLLAGQSDVTSEQKELLEKRAKARAQKDFEESDRTRDLLLDQGIEVRDTPKGQVWSRL